MEVVTPAAEKPIESQEKEELVSKKVVEEYKNDMFKHKTKARELESELQKYKDEIALREKQQLEDDQQWKLLYEKEKESKTKVLQDLQSKSDFFVNTSKINSVVQKLGGFKKDSYAKFIDTSKIDVRDDGTFDSDSIAREVDRIKQEYPELLNVGANNGKMPSNAPNVLGVPKTLGNLSRDELLAAFTQKNKQPK